MPANSEFLWTDSAGAPTANIRNWIGFAGTAPSFGFNTAAPYGSDTYASLNLIGFRYSTAASDSSFVCVTCASGSCTTNLTGIVPATGVQYRMKIKTDGSSSAKFSINGQVVCDHNTNIPGFQTLVPSLTSQTLDGSGKHLRFHRLRVRAED